MKIKKNILFYNLISILLIIISFLGKEHFNLITWLLIIETIITVFTMRKGNSFLSVGTIFIIFTLLFHCGQAMIITFGINDPYYKRSVIAEAIGNEFIIAEIYVLISIFFWGKGYLYWTNKKSKNIVPINKESMLEDNSLKFIRNVAIIVLAISIFPLIYTDLLKIFTLKSGGYMATYDTYKNGIGKYLSLIAKFARPAISILLISYKNDNKKCRLVLLLSCIYFTVMMLSGDRSTNIIYMMVNLFLYYKIVKKMKFKTVITYLIIGYFFLGFISSISMFRYSELTISSFFNVFSIRSSDGIIYSCLREFGGTMKTLMYAMRFIPEYSPYNYGLTYIIGLTNISPKLPISFVDNFSNCFGYVNVFPTAYQNSLGGSFLGELYYNFGWFGIFVTSIVGFYIGKLDYMFEKEIYNKNWVKVAIITSFIPYIILWVRDYFSGIFFVGFWMMILFKIFNKKKIYNQNFNNIKGVKT